MYDIYCRLRDDKKLKDSDVAKATGITKSTFSDWKTGRSKPKQDKLQKIADFFGVTLDYLMNGTCDNQINTIAAHHDDAEWTEEELEEIEEFKRYVLSKRKNDILLSAEYCNHNRRHSRRLFVPRALPWEPALKR